MTGVFIRSVKNLKRLRLPGSERGVALLIVLVLSGIALAVMTALIYMITAGVQVSRMQKNYKTALDAGIGGWEILNQIVTMRANDVDTNALLNTLNTSFSMNTALTTDGACSGTAGGVAYSGLKAKMLTDTSTWSASCNKSLTIDPLTPASYDMKMEIGAANKYTVYAKIVHTTDGNTGAGGGTGLSDSGGVVNSTANITPKTVPFLYAIEVDAENAANRSERVKLSILYEF